MYCAASGSYYSRAEGHRRGLYGTAGQFTAGPLRLISCSYGNNVDVPRLILSASAFDVIVLIKRDGRVGWSLKSGEIALTELWLVL